MMSKWRVLSCIWRIKVALRLKSLLHLPKHQQRRMLPQLQLLLSNYY
jgi:hypothetical protein